MVASNGVALVLEVKALNLHTPESCDVKLDYGLNKLLKVTRLGPVVQLPADNLFVVKPVFLEGLVLEELVEVLVDREEERERRGFLLHFGLKLADPLLQCRSQQVGVLVLAFREPEQVGHVLHHKRLEVRKVKLELEELISIDFADGVSQVHQVLVDVLEQLSNCVLGLLSLLGSTLPAVGGADVVRLEVYLDHRESTQRGVWWLCELQLENFSHLNVHDGFLALLGEEARQEVHLGVEAHSCVNLLRCCTAEYEFEPIGKLVL